MNEPRAGKRAPQEHSYERPRKPLVTQSNSPDVPFIPWYSKTTDYCYYNEVQTACKAAKKKILQLRTTPEEGDLLANPPATIEGIRERLYRLAEDKDKTRQRHSDRSVQRSLDFRSEFLRVIHQMSALTTILVPVVAEANIVISMMMIIFRVAVTRREREEALLDKLRDMSPKLPAPDMYSSMEPDNTCKMAAARLFVDLVDFTEILLFQFRYIRTGKLFSALVSSLQDNLADCLDNMEAKSTAFKHATYMVLRETSNVDSSTQPNKKQTNLTDKMSQSIMATLESLDVRMTALEKTASQISRFTMVQHSQNLISALMTNPLEVYWNPEESLAHTGSHHWENNELLKALSGWRDHPKGPLVWIGGLSDIQQQPLISQFSIDAIKMLRLSRIPCFYVLCSDFPSLPLPFTSTRILKSLLCQLLHFRPNIAYEMSEIFTISLFQCAALSFTALWEIFERLVEALSDDVFIIIDRIDQVQSDDVSQVTNDVIRSMIALANKFPRVQVLLTSVYEPPLELSSYQQAGSMEVFPFNVQQGRLM